MFVHSVFYIYYTKTHKYKPNYGGLLLQKYSHLQMYRKYQISIYPEPWFQINIITSWGRSSVYNGKMVSIYLFKFKKKTI